MAAVKFTEQWLAQIQPTGKAVTYWDAALTGFCLSMGVAGTKTFYVMTRVEGRKIRVKIGRAGARAPGGQTWTVALARRKAQEILGRAASGELATPAPKRSSGPTLREGLELHVENMERDACSPRSIKSIRSEVTKHIEEWLDRPIVELTPAVLNAAYKGILETAKPRKGSVNKPGAAVAVRLLAHVSAIWESVDKLHGLPEKNPAMRVKRHAIKPRQSRIQDSEFQAWLASVQTLTPLREDLHMFALFSGLRSESARWLRWEDIDWERALAHVTKAKGDRPYTIPITDTHFEILRRRQRANAPEFGPHGGDHGWVFPGLARDTRKVQPVASGRPWNRDSELPGMHDLRRTYNSVGREIGIPVDALEALMNHNNKGINRRVYTVIQNWDFLADCQRQIEAALWERLGRRDKNASGAVQSKKSRAHLRVLNGGDE